MRALKMPLVWMLITFVAGGCARRAAVGLPGGGLSVYTRAGARAIEAPTTKPVVLVDIDDTILEFPMIDAVRLVLRVREENLREFPEASQAFWRLQERWRVVFLTARDDSLRKPTLRWLEANGFPDVPVVFSKRYRLTARSQERFRSQVIRRLRSRGVHPAVGIGDKAGDVAAYLGNDTTALIIVRDAKDRDLRHLRKRLARDPDLKARSGRLFLFTRDKPTPVWNRIVAAMKADLRSVEPGGPLN